MTVYPISPSVTALLILPALACYRQSNRILFTSKDEKTICKTAIIPDDGLVQRLLDPAFRSPARSSCGY